MLHMWHQPADAEPEMPGSGSDQTYTESHGCTEPPRLKLIFGDFEPLLYRLSSSNAPLLGPGGSSLYSAKCRIRAAGSEPLGQPWGASTTFLVMSRDVIEEPL